MTAFPFPVAGISLDCGDPPELIGFYLRLLGGRQLWSDAEGAGMKTDSGLVLVAQAVSNYIPPSWPGSSVVHLDLDAGKDLRRAVDHASKCGARLAEVQPDARWSVMLDPAGHPFCLTTSVWSE